MTVVDRVLVLIHQVHHMPTLIIGRGSMSLMTPVRLILHIAIPIICTLVHTGYTFTSAVVYLTKTPGAKESMTCGASDALVVIGPASTTVFKRHYKVLEILIQKPVVNRIDSKTMCNPHVINHTSPRCMRRFIF